MLSTIGSKISAIVEARGVTERLDAIAEYFGLDRADERVPLYRPKMLRSDGLERDVVFARFQIVLAFCAFTALGCCIAAQIRIAITRQPAPVVGSYYVDHDGSAR